MTNFGQDWSSFDSTCIDDVKADRPADGIIYTLNGRQVASDKPLTRGFYIKDGRKFMVR